jgi:hypothetical protein
MNLQIVTALFAIPVLAGCQGSSAEDTTPMKTATYYTQNLHEAQQVASRCKLLDAHKQRTLSIGDYQDWQISNQGVNCQTALSVSDAASMRELVLKQAKPPAPVAAPKISSPPSSSVPTLRERADQKLNVSQTLAPV